jgi:CheY-like chemotaxis protein
MDGYGKRVLIIDDNEDILYLAGTALMDRGYNVYTAAEGRSKWKNDVMTPCWWTTRCRG